MSVNSGGALQPGAVVGYAPSGVGAGNNPGVDGYPRSLPSKGDRNFTSALPRLPSSQACAMRIDAEAPHMKLSEPLREPTLPARAPHHRWGEVHLWEPTLPTDGKTPRWWGHHPTLRNLDIFIKCLEKVAGISESRVGVPAGTHIACWHTVGAHIAH